VASFSNVAHTPARNYATELASARMRGLHVSRIVASQRRTVGIPVNEAATLHPYAKKTSHVHLKSLLPVTVSEKKKRLDVIFELMYRIHQAVKHLSNVTMNVVDWKEIAN
jgi:hypothetical protein